VPNVWFDGDFYQTIINRVAGVAFDGTNEIAKKDISSLSGGGVCCFGLCLC